ncbi:putative bifunctional diguanylate cyclase/phosphodiesterase [Massilia sp. DWR3-1-1]|uniref:putative bifunctional diguanylate cyclase/phosphodiesterase n=1 Tax=Massilia sp. DWR3-1-1 TaxID=2804559 RepID=UPI003CE9E181
MLDHTVQFYENERFLVKAMVDYVGTALANGATAVALATAPHLRAMEAALRHQGLLDDKTAATVGCYRPLDAHDVLSQFMVDGLPDPQRFERSLGVILRDAQAQAPGPLAVLAEVGALLRADRSNPGTDSAPPLRDGAILVEEMVVALMEDIPFDMLCLYPLAAFPGAEDQASFHQTCCLHSEVRPAESFDALARRDTLQRSVAGLQQQAHALRREVRNRQQVEQALREVNIDKLTGLANRNVFQDRLDIDIKKALRSGLPLALLFIDLDHFKEINDTRGHEAGDQLLKAVGRRLQSHVRGSDTVARLGGDEFTITLAELHDLGYVTDLAQKLCDDLARPFMIDEEMAYISASIGITIFPRDASTAGELLRNADQAMYRSKERGRNRFAYFKSSMQDAAQNRMTISNELRRAVDEEQLEVYYQPIVDLESGRIRKAEALLRWQHPERGEISPLEFIPIAEHTGLITTIGDWVFQRALAQARNWRQYDPELTINVNVSPLQFYDGDGGHCRRWLSESATVPEMGLEITEGLLLSSDIDVLKQLLAFQQAGIAISLDDFGTGYSSLSYLRRFALDFLKIDKSFVYNLEFDAANVALCEAIIVMAHKLGLQVVAEGVETPQQAALLKEAGCDFAQGFLFGHAMAAPQFESMLLAN